MKNERHLDRAKAKELLVEVEAAAASASGSEARQKVVKLLNGVPTYNWVGIYLVKGNDLRLAAWSGPAATVHTSIPIGKGVCGWAAKSGRTEIVSDVSKDPRYLECFANTKSEIVVPIHLDGRVVGEIDVDSDELNAHSSTDREFLEAVAAKIAKHCVA
ncbi:MAG: GAF domain-containing protein [Nitrososphaerales archaeon]|jgi:GAF domain-containing protein